MAWNRRLHIYFAFQVAYLGLPQMKAYYEINVFFKFRTVEPNGLIMYNAGKGKVGVKDKTAHALSQT